jgi:hypothetical protein
VPYQTKDFMSLLNRLRVQKVKASYGCGIRNELWGGAADSPHVR